MLISSWIQFFGRTLILPATSKNSITQFSQRHIIYQNYEQHVLSVDTSLHVNFISQTCRSTETMLTAVLKGKVINEWSLGDG